MSRAHRTTGVRDDAIAFILFCLIGVSLLGTIATALVFTITAMAH